MATFVHTLARLVHELLTDRKWFWVVVLLVVIGDAFITELIIRFIPYTEIDWKTYMAQVEVYTKGQLDYSKIAGPTGPIVYPAGHIHIHRLLHDLTQSGENIALAQHIYAGLYITSLTLTSVIYGLAGVPNWVILFLPLSKRLHSIFVLRLFNDCWSVVAMQAAVLAYQCAMDDIGTLLFSVALSVKMSIILYLPALLVILFKRRGLLTTTRHLATIVLTQILIGLPFLREYPLAYLQSSFDFSRVFFYKWTVNWRILDEQTFLSPLLAKVLLVGHASALIAFGLFRWCKDDGGVWVVLERGLRRPKLSPALKPITADYVATTLFTSNLVGVLFARSLHYQFYSWYAYQLPFLAWNTRYPIAVKILLLAAIEYAWNVFPSTRTSSAVLLLSNTLLLFGVWSNAGTKSKNTKII